jgi:hypothetical protein
MGAGFGADKWNFPKPAEKSIYFVITVLRRCKALFSLIYNGSSANTLFHTGAVGRLRANPACGPGCGIFKTLL